MPTKTKTKTKQKQKQTINIRISNVNKNSKPEEKPKRKYTRRKTQLAPNQVGGGGGFVNPYDRSVILQDPNIYRLTNELDNLKKTQLLLTNDANNTPINLARQQLYIANQGTNVLDKINDNDIDNKRLIEMEKMFARNRERLASDDNDGISVQSIFTDVRSSAYNSKDKYTPEGSEYSKPLIKTPQGSVSSNKPNPTRFAPTQEQITEQLEKMRKNKSRPSSISSVEYNEPQYPTMKPIKAPPPRPPPPPPTLPSFRQFLGIE
jgi:hypothetical protein